MASYFDDHQEREADRERRLNMENAGFDPTDPESILAHLGVVTRNQQPPASKAVIDTLPTFKITAEEFAKGASCAVCMEAFPLNAHPTRLPCFHLYHRECVVEWLKRHNNCPTCRHELETDDRLYNDEKTRERVESRGPPPSMFG
eukprot:comp18400_c0_seq1/m.19598 comp18400_c0_seq1/g.19598  ORF comp18400_c0_seq1/g.19598 comp18400_c0_seq1/m.19598 type:complete len:145 (-) comp18400_c0_seq1:109-543(-)